MTAPAAPLIVQIYSLTAAEDVRALVDLGVDHLGFAVDEAGVPAGISLAQGRVLFDLVPDDVKTVSLTVKTDVEPIRTKVQDLPPDVLHLCPDTDALGVDDQRAIREELPDDVEVMKAIEVDGPEAVRAAVRFAPQSDYLILDTATQSVPGIGASGTTHDWSVSREIVKSVDVPVVLAGGLGPDNVAEAVRTVQPAGVDSYTRTSRTPERKDLGRVATFVQRARAAARAIESNGEADGA